MCLYVCVYICMYIHIYIYIYGCVAVRMYTYLIYIQTYNMMYVHSVSYDIALGLLHQTSYAYVYDWKYEFSVRCSRTMAAFVQES